MSTRFSPDGMYYWDGSRWVSTISPDRRFRWDGSSWVPVAFAPPQFVAQPTVREPTSWTRPLQYAVAAYYAISALVSLSLPFWMSGQMSQIMQASFQRQAQQNPNLQAPPPGFYDTLNAMMTGILWVAAVFGVAFAVLFIIGALKRWVWAYYVVLIFLGLGVVSGPANLLQFATGSSVANYGYTTPTWLYIVGFATWFPATALFVVMLIALIKRGPWGMRKATGGGTPAA